MKALSLYWLDNTDQLTDKRQQQAINALDPALNLLSQQCVDNHLPAVLARESFRSEQVSTKLVVNKEHQLLGIVSAEQLSEQNILRLQSEQRVPRTEVLVGDVMQARSDILVMDYRDVAHATVQDVALALKTAGQAHCLVVDREQHIIHGFLSMQEIALDKSLLANEENAMKFIQLHHVVAQ